MSPSVVVTQQAEGNTASAGRLPAWAAPDVGIADQVEGLVWTGKDVRKKSFLISY